MTSRSTTKLTVDHELASLASLLNMAATLKKWTLQDAKNQLSALVRQARVEGPQRITVHGREAVVVVAVEEYERLSGGGDMNLVQMLKSSPLAEALASGDLKIERSGDLGRMIEL